MITSFAQALEDVVLHRALAGVEGGFYIDVGANDPVIDSVTKHFYESGWRGVNIEPSPRWFAKIEADRPRDVNLNFAASDAPGTLTFHEIEDTGLSTLRVDVASRHEARGMKKSSYDVKAETLAAICDKYAPETIHFLKVDVEGAEEQVLRGADFGRHRPWIVLVEATEPMSDAPSHAGWEPLLVEAGYDFVLFDGLNRFYVAHERPELKPKLAFRGDDYRRIADIWTLGHWRGLAEEREKALEAIKATRWWRARIGAIRLGKSLSRRFSGV